jgi:heptosyltransferase-2
LKRILLRGPNWVGDAVLAVPAMKTIRTIFPGAEITLLVRPWVSGVFTSARFVDHVWTEAQPAGIRQWLRLAAEIRNRRFDLAVLFPNSFEAAAMAFAGRVPRRLGYATDGRRLLLTDALRASKEKQHLADYYRGLARSLSPGAEQSTETILAAPHDREQARRLLSSAGIERSTPFLVINPGAAYGSAKRWFPERFAAVADTLSAERDLAVVIIGSETERSIAEEVRGRMHQRAAVMNGKTSLETLLGLIAESSLIVTNDSGPMHIGAALGVPTVAIFGATDPVVTGPRGARVRVVREPVDCSPCLLRECPIDHRCMTRVDSDAVCQAAREVMG